MKSTILDGRPAYRPDGEAGNRTSYSPVGAGTGAELGNESECVLPHQAPVDQLNDLSLASADRLGPLVAV